MKENENLNAPEIESGDALRQQLLSSKAGNPKGYEYFKENAGYMAAYTAHILEQLKKKQETYREINNHRSDQKLAQQIETFQTITNAFSSLENDVDTIQAGNFDRILEGLKGFKAQFFGKNRRGEPLYNSLAFYNKGFADGIDKDTFIETVSDMGDTLGMGFSEAAYELAKEQPVQIRADEAGAKGISDFRKSNNASLLMKLIDPQEFYYGTLGDFDNYRRDLKKQFDNSYDDREKSVLHALITNMDVLADLKDKHKQHYRKHNGGGDLQYRQDLLIQMNQVLSNIQMLHAQEAKDAPRNSFLRQNTKSFGAPEYAAYKPLDDLDYLFENTYHYFENNNSKAREQYYYRTQPLAFAIPEYANTKSAALYLALDHVKEDSELKKEFSALRASLYLLQRYPVPASLGVEDEQIQTGIKVAASNLYKAAKELEESIRSAADALDKKTADQKLTAAEQKLSAFMRTLDEIRNDYREMPEVIEKMNGLCGNLFSKWQTLNLSEGIGAYLRTHKDVNLQLPSFHQYNKKAFEAYDDDLYYIARDQVQASMPDQAIAKAERDLVGAQASAIQKDTAKKFFQSAVDNSGLYKSLNGLLTQLQATKTVLDEKRNNGDQSGKERSMDAFLINSDIISQLAKIVNAGNKYKEAHAKGNADITDQQAQGLFASLQTLTEKCRSVNKRDNLQINALLDDKFKRKLNALADQVDALKNTGIKAADPIDSARRYLYTHTGSNVPNEDKAKTEMAANSLSAYIWVKSAEKVTADQKRPVFSTSKIEDYGRTIMKNPIFKAAVKRRELDPARVENLARLQDTLDRPFSQRFGDDLKSLKRTDRALKSLKELGSILDHDKGANRDYKAFFKSLKKLENINLDYLPADKKCELLNDIYHCTEKFMKGRKSTRFFKESREHFEQCLDVLAIFKEYGGYGKDIADGLVNRTNEVRRKHWFQKEVTLEGRSNAKTRKRLMELRKIQKTEKADVEIDLRDKAIDKEGLVRANENLEKQANKDRLTQVDAGDVIDVNEKKTELTQYLTSKNVASPVKARQCINQMLALSIIPAYKNEEGKAVIREGQFKKACEIMQDHEVAKELADKYRYKTERKELLKAEEPLKKLREEFNERNKELIRERKLQDAEMLGENAKGLSYEEYKQACENKRKEEKENEKERIKEKLRLKKQQLQEDEKMDREYLGYLDRITAAKKIDPKRRLELLVDYYIQGKGERPVPEEDLQQVQQMAAQKQQQNAIRM